MNARMAISREEIERVQGHNIWDFGNRILYDMCKSAPLHVNEDEIIGKIWLIGRSYAAAIERGANQSGDLFYTEHVARKIRAVGTELDRRIAALQEHRKVSKEMLSEVIETHRFLTKIFSEISGKINRSLASKYLHFHLPNIFYIYDSRSINGVTNLKTLDKPLKKDLLRYDNDSSYVDFVAKIYPLNVRIYKEHGIWLTPRELDALLLGY